MHPSSVQTFDASLGPHNFEDALRELAAKNPVVRLAVASVGMTKEEADNRRKLEQLLIHAHPEVTEANAITGWISRYCVC